MREGAYLWTERGVFGKGSRLLKNSVAPAPGPRSGSENVNFGPLEPVYAPINVPISTFSTASNLFGTGYKRSHQGGRVAAIH
jgi:hypothetical protein